MNFGIVRYILCQVIRIEGILMLLPCLVSLIYSDGEGLVYLCVAAFLIIAGFTGCKFRPKNQNMSLKEGYAATGLSWIVMSIFGCLPFVITGEIPSFTDALFETVSGFTTTGASILSDVESLSHTAIFWRSFTHWIGGMGVLVFLLAVIPMTGGSNINLMKAESTGPSVGKLVPRIRRSALILYEIYMTLTAIEVIFLLAGGMKLFDSLCIAFGTAGTGGFSITNDSFMSYSTYIRWVVGIFMLLFSINFNAYYYILMKEFRKAFTMEEVRDFLLLVAAAVIIIFFNILNSYERAFDALTDAFFQVSSLVSTSGFASADFDLWPSASKFILCLMMFMGACAGSTGGGIKVSRIVYLVKSSLREFGAIIHPKMIRKITFDGKPIDAEILKSTNAFFVAYNAVFFLSLFMVTLNGFDLATSFTAVLATLNNIGPGLALVGPTCNFSFFASPVKYVLIFDMLAGRLELFPMLVLLHPGLYKK